MTNNNKYQTIIFLVFFGFNFFENVLSIHKEEALKWLSFKDIDGNIWLCPFLPKMRNFSSIKLKMCRFATEIA